MADRQPPPFPLAPGLHDQGCAVLGRVLDWLLADWWRLSDRVTIASPHHELSVQTIRHVHIRPELFIQLGGTTAFHFPDQRITLHHGDMLLLPRLLPHQEFNRDGPEPFCNLVVMPNPGFLGLHISGTLGPKRQGIVPGSQAQIRSPHLEAVNACIDACIRRRFGPLHDERPMQTHVLLRAALVCLRDILTEYERDSDPDKDRVARCRNLIDLHLQDPNLSVAELGDWTGCHPDHLSRLFRKSTGRSVQGYLIDQRLALAKRLLRNSDLSVADIAQACGFADPAYFSRSFKRAIGSSPKHYRLAIDPDEGNAAHA